MSFMEFPTQADWVDPRSKNKQNIRTSIQHPLWVTFFNKKIHVKQGNRNFSAKLPAWEKLRLCLHDPVTDLRVVGTQIATIHFKAELSQEVLKCDDFLVSCVCWCNLLERWVPNKYWWNSLLFPSMSCISVTSWWNISCLTCKKTHGFCFSQFYNLKQFKIDAWIAELYMFSRCLFLSMWSTIVQAYTQRINSLAAFQSKEPPPDCSFFGTGGVEWISHGQEFPRLRGIFDGGAPHHEPVCRKDWRRSFCDIFLGFQHHCISTEFLTRAQFRWFSQLFNRTIGPGGQDSVMGLSLCLLKDLSSRLEESNCGRLRESQTLITAFLSRLNHVFQHKLRGSDVRQPFFCLKV